MPDDEKYKSPGITRYTEVRARNRRRTIVSKLSRNLIDPQEFLRDILLPLNVHS